MFVAGEIEQIALSLGIDACGVAKAKPLTQDADYLRKWTEAGYHGSMDYMARNIHLREDITQLLPDCKTVVVCLFNYYKSARQTPDAPRIAQCGLSQSDYHIYVKQKLRELADALSQSRPAMQIFPPVEEIRGGLYCDSAPIFERRWAVEAGLGWIGKNHLFIHPTLGSFVHIGILLLTEECETYGTPLVETSQWLVSSEEKQTFPPVGGIRGGLWGCGDCTLCLHACPTGAIRGTHFDARKCVSYLTIERKEPLEDKYRSLIWTPQVETPFMASPSEEVQVSPLYGGTEGGLGRLSLYGCDRCQDVCPYNQNLQDTPHTALQANPQLLTMTVVDWQNTSRRQKLKLLRRLSK